MPKIIAVLGKSAWLQKAFENSGSLTFAFEACLGQWAPLFSGFGNE